MRQQAAWVIMSMALIAFVNVLSHYFINFSIGATEEIAINLFVRYSYSRASTAAGLFTVKESCMISIGFFTVVKVVVSILVVVLLSLIAEWASPRIAGVVSGYPLGAAISLYFIGLENGPGFAAHSAIFTAAGLAATVAFVAGYLLGIRLAKGRRRFTSLAISILPGIAAYGLVAWMLSFIPINAASALLIATTGMVLAARVFRSIPDVKIQQKIRLGFSVTLLRAAFAALVILAITSAARVVGPRWAGLFSAFPITMLPLLVIIQYTYQPDHVRTIIKNVPRGLGSLLTYTMVVAASYSGLGIGWGTLLGYLAATIYLIMLEYGMRGKVAARMIKRQPYDIKS